MSKAITYFKEAKQELAKVSWPDRTKLFETTAIVLGCAAVFAVAIYSVDLLFSEIFRQLLLR